MEVQCPICLDVDMNGRILQCDEGHFFCKKCYDRHVATKERVGVRARCPECRIELLPTPIRCLAAEKAIAAKKEQQAAVIAEVQQAEAEAVTNEVVAAAAAADAHAERQDATAAFCLGAKLNAEEQLQAQIRAQAADAEAMAIAQEHGEGDVAAQREQLAAYSRKRSRECMQSLDTSHMKAIVREVVAKNALDQISPKDVRLEMERTLTLNAGALKARKREIATLIDEVLNECTNCQTDLSDVTSGDDLTDPNDGRAYCFSCWKAMALGARRPTA